MTPTKPKRERMANGNGNGNGYSNGRLPISTVAQLSATGVLLLGMFGLWWQSADPRSRLDKIEESVVQVRREYTSQNEHHDLVRKVEDAILQGRADYERALTKDSFEAWKRERDNYLSLIVTRLDKLEAKLYGASRNAGLGG